MKKITIALLALAVVLAVTPAAMADTWSFNISGSGISSSGTLTFQPTATPGVDELTGITGTYTDSNGNYSGTITGLYPNPTYTPVIDSTYLFLFDNLFYPGDNAPQTCLWGSCSTNGQLDLAGMLFYVNVNGGGVAEVGIGSIGTSGSLYNLNSEINGVYQDGGNNGVDVNFAATPEPSSLLLLGTALFGLAFVVFKKAKASGLVVQS